MGKYTLWALLLCLTCSQGFGQRYQSDREFGLKGGLTLANPSVKTWAVTGSVVPETQSRASVYAGIFLEYSLGNISENLYGQIELQYVSGGFMADGSKEAREFSNKLSQLNAPFIFKYQVVEPLLITAGVYWGLVLKVEEEDGDGKRLDSTEKFKAFDAGLIIGAEVPITETFFLEARYNFGLVDMVEPPTVGGSDSYLNRFVQLGLGVKF